VKITFHEPKQDHVFAGPVTVISFGKAQYQWHPAGRDGYADPDNPPIMESIDTGADTAYTLPAASVTVLRGKLN